MNEAKPKLVVMDQNASEKKPSTGRGAAQMREAADMIMEKDCLEIAEALSKNSKNGQIQSVKFMYELALQNEKSGEGEGAGKFRSIAMEWASSPEWKGDSEAEESDKENAE